MQCSGRPYRLEDVLRARTLVAGAPGGTVALSPRRSHIACVVRCEGDHLPPDRGAVLATPPLVRRAHVLVVEIATGMVTEVSPPDASAWAPVWNADGSRLAFYATPGDGARLELWSWMVGASTAGPLSETETSAVPADGGPQWLADGESLVVWQKPGGRPVAPADTMPSPIVFRSPLAVRYATPPVCDVLAISAADRTSRALLPDRPVGDVIPSPGSAAFLWMEPQWASKRTLHLVTHCGNHHDLCVLSQGKAVAVRWDPLGRRFALVSGGAVTVFDAESPSAPPTLLPLPEGRHPKADVLLWTSDGGALVVRLGADLWLCPLDPPIKARLLAAHGFTAVAPISTRIGQVARRNIFALARDAETWDSALLVLRPDAEPERVTLPTPPLHDLGFTDLDPVGDSFVYAASEPGRPGDLWLMAGPPRQYSTFNPHLRDVALSTRLTFPFRTTRGEQVGARVVLPSGPGPHPTVFSVYPGMRPSRSRGVDRFAAGAVIPDDLLAAWGYAVVHPDIPHMPTEESPLDAVESAVVPAVDEAVRLGLADPDRLAVVGHSFGAYAVVGLLARTDRFQAAVAACGVYDLVSTYLSGVFLNPQRLLFLNQTWIETGQIGLRERLWDNPSKYIESSPIFSLDRVRTPLLLVAAGGDQPLSVWTQAAEVFTGMRLLKRECVLLVYPGEDHVPGAWSQDNRLDLASRTQGWLAQHLSDKAP